MSAVIPGGCAVIVFAKAPQAGHAKTRLIPALGADGAARLAQRLLEHAVAQAVAARVGPLHLVVTPDGRHPVFDALVARHALALEGQGGGDLGARMARAFERVLRTHRAALLIGSDIPDLDAAYLQAAARALDTADAVFGPAADGGYALVGLKQPAPALFTGMRWSSPQVMAHTRARIAALGLRHVELPLVHDVDEPADLIHLPAPWRAVLQPIATIPSTESR